jgi:hypothetical protein
MDWILALFWFVAGAIAACTVTVPVVVKKYERREIERCEKCYAADEVSRLAVRS